MKKKELEKNFPNRIKEVFITNDEVIVKLTDKRRLAIPRDWFNLRGYENFKNATDEELKTYEVDKFGEAVYFPKVNEYLGIHTFLGGLHAPCS